MSLDVEEFHFRPYSYINYLFATVENCLTVTNAYRRLGYGHQLHDVQVVDIGHSLGFDLRGYLNPVNFPISSSSTAKASIKCATKFFSCFNSLSVVGPIFMASKRSFIVFHFLELCAESHIVSKSTSICL